MTSSYFLKRVWFIELWSVTSGAGRNAKYLIFARFIEPIKGEKWITRHCMRYCGHFLLFEGGRGKYERPAQENFANLHNSSCNKVSLTCRQILSSIRDHNFISHPRWLRITTQVYSCTEGYQFPCTHLLTRTVSPPEFRNKTWLL